MSRMTVALRSLMRTRTTRRLIGPALSIVVAGCDTPARSSDHLPQDGAPVATAEPAPPAPPPPVAPKPEDEITADQLLELVATCDVKRSSAPYASDVGAPANIDVCGLVGAVFWKADLDVDCDGKQSTVCNVSTDPGYQPQTAATDSSGAYLDAATLPYVVVPRVSARFDYRAAGLALGSVVAVLYEGKMELGIIGDLGPSSIIGEASYAMAARLGIDPAPSTGGVPSGVTYIAFTGVAAEVNKKEDHAEAVAIGKALAKKLAADNHP